MSEPLSLTDELDTIKVLHAKMVETAQQIDAIVQRCSNLLRLAQSAAERVAQANRPPAPPVVVEQQGLTPLSKGPLRILELLYGVGDVVISRLSIGSALGMSQSTVRTYLPVLMRERLIMDAENSKSHVGLTAAGRAFVRRHSEENFKPTSNDTHS